MNMEIEKTKFQIGSFLFCCNTLYMVIIFSVLAINFISQFYWNTEKLELTCRLRQKNILNSLFPKVRKKAKKKTMNSECILKRPEYLLKLFLIYMSLDMHSTNICGTSYQRIHSRKIWSTKHFWLKLFPFFHE